MGRRVLGGLMVGTAVVAWSMAARAQAPSVALSVVPGSETAHAFFAAPGLYGTSLGTASYGSVRTYSEFSSPYGGGYGYGYAPSGFIPGPYGAGLWRPSTVQTPLYNAAYQSYRTFPVPYVAGVSAVTPSIGFYAPAFGPPYPPGFL